MYIRKTKLFIKMNVTGVWKYKEDFALGLSQGEVKLVQTDNTVYGEFTFVEKVEGNYEIEVFEKVKGEIVEGKALLKSIEVKALQDGKEVSYLGNNFEVHLVSDSKLVGSSYDEEEVCGVFTLERI